MAQQLRPILDVAHDLGLAADDLILYGKHKAKIDLSVLDRQTPNGKLILVTAITPTPAGEGKTTTSIGLGQALRAQGERVCLALREPSLGPCFGVKGGGTGGGASKAEPSVDINLHFNGDFHAITSAHNLLASIIDNSLFFGNPHGIDTRRIVWPRVLDLNDRALRQVVVGLGGASQGTPRETGFEITAASEVMAVLCLAKDREDLQRRLDNIIVAYRPGKGPLLAGELEVTSAMVALLNDAIVPNLVQTTDGTPAILHGGPFANIAHGCNSVIATKSALKLADWVVTEAGFGCDLGAEKFIDLKCASTGLNPSAVVLVATVRALKMHGGVPVKVLGAADAAAVARGLPNLEKHLETIANFGKPAVVAINRFPTDTEAELQVVADACEKMGVAFAVADHFTWGAAGAEVLARAVMAVTPDEPTPLKTIYQADDSVSDKIAKVAKEVYGADGIQFTAEAQLALRRITRLGYDHLPICMAKTQSSLSDDPKKIGRPTGFEITVRDIVVNGGAEFLVVLTGSMLRMPGLPKKPQAAGVRLVDGEILGVG